MTPEEIARGIAAVTAVLDDARDQADAGARVDLAGLDARVAELCAAASSLPPAPARAQLGALERMLAALDSLTDALTRQRDTLAAAADGRNDPHTARQRAAAAYGRPGPAGDPVPVPVPVPVPDPGTDDRQP